MTIAYKTGEKGERPWGTWEVLAVGTGYIVKRIVVNPGQILSLQLHHHRSENWIISVGEAEITVGDQILIGRRAQSFYIPVETKHRIAN